VSKELLWLLVLPLVWWIGWSMAFQWVKLRWMIQLNQLKEQTAEAQKLVQGLQKTQEDWLRRDSRLAMEHSLQSLRPIEQEK
jgi:hypothetical protein